MTTSWSTGNSSRKACQQASLRPTNAAQGLASEGLAVPKPKPFKLGRHLRGTCGFFTSSEFPDWPVAQTAAQPRLLGFLHYSSWANCKAGIEVAFAASRRRRSREAHRSSDSCTCLGCRSDDTVHIDTHFVTGFEDGGSSVAYIPPLWRCSCSKLHGLCFQDA